MVLIFCPCHIAHHSRPSAEGKFTRAACQLNDCIQRNRHNTLCFYPDPDTPIGDLPKVTCSDENLASALDAHLPMHARRPTPFTPWNPSNTYYLLANDSWTLLGSVDFPCPFQYRARRRLLHAILGSSMARHALLRRHATTQHRTTTLTSVTYPVYPRHACGAHTPCNRLKVLRDAP